MREVICGLYIILFTFITAPMRYINTRSQDPQHIKDGQAKNYRLAQRMSKGIIKISGIKLDIKGGENLNNNGATVYMGTHKSYLDIVIMLALIDQPLIFIGKEELRRVPFIRTWFKDVGGVAMQRDDIRQSYKVIMEVIEKLKEGYSVAIFPEGTRAITKDMGEFKVGSFKLATKANVPIIPIAMQNTFKSLEENRRLRPADIYVNVGEVIDVPSLTFEEKKTIAKDTENYMRELLDEITM